MPTIREQIEPTVRKLEVAGNFAGGIMLDATSCKHLAKGLKHMAEELDRQESLRLRGWLARQYYMPVLLAVGFFVVMGLVFNG